LWKGACLDRLKAVRRALSGLMPTPRRERQNGAAAHPIALHQGQHRLGFSTTSFCGVIRGALGVQRLPEVRFGGLGQPYGGTPDAALRQRPADLAKELELLGVAQAIIADREMKPKGDARPPG
jgi:hypothetical protein